MRLADTCSKGCCAVCFAAMFLMAQEAPVTVFRSESRLVDVYASVFDRKGNPVDGILKERFAILDAGSVQPIVSFETESKSISCAILLDTTGSMKDALASVKNAVSMFVDELRKDDSAAIFDFSTSLRTLQDFTTEKGSGQTSGVAHEGRRRNGFIRRGGGSCQVDKCAKREEGHRFIHRWQ